MCDVGIGWPCSAYLRFLSQDCDNPLDGDGDFLAVGLRGIIKNLRFGKRGVVIG